MHQAQAHHWSVHEINTHVPYQNNPPNRWGRGRGGNRSRGGRGNYYNQGNRTPQVRFLDPDSAEHQEAARRADVGQLFNKPAGRGTDARSRQRFFADNDDLPYTMRDGYFYPDKATKPIPLHPKQSVFVQRENGQTEFAHKVREHFDDACVKCGMGFHVRQHPGCPLLDKELTLSVCKRCHSGLHSMADCLIHPDFVPTDAKN